MKTDNLAAFLSLLLFLFLATAPVALVFAHYYGVLQLPQPDYGSIMVFATAALFLLPVFFVLFAAAAMLLKKKKERGGVVAKRVPKPEHYPWEDVFKVKEGEESEEFRAAKAKAVAVVPKVNFKALAVAAFVAAVTIVFLVAFVPEARDVILGLGGNATSVTANVTSEALPEDQELKNVLFTLLRRNLTAVQKAKPKVEAETEAKPAATVAIAAKAKLAAKSVTKSVDEVKGAVKRSVSYAKAKAKASLRYWHYAAVGIGVLLIAGALFYGYRKRKGKLGSFFKPFARVFAVAKRNKSKIVIASAALAVLAAIVAAFVFRKWLVAKLSGVVDVSRLSAGLSAGLSAAKDFLSAYRLYIVIGVAALAVILGILFLLERRQK